MITIAKNESVFHSMNSDQVQIDKLVTRAP